MPTAEELIVALKSEGAQEVNNDLKNTERRMEGTADAAEEQADRLGGFANKIKGAMAAIVAGLAIGAAGILSQVPVIGEAMAGLKAVFNALTLQIDKRLRPGLTKLNKEFFELANAIMSGNYSQVKKELKDIAGVIKGFVTGVNITQLVKKFQNFAADAIGGLVTRITKFAQSLTVGDFRKFNATLIGLAKRGLKKLINAADWSAFAIALVTMLGKAVVGRQQAVKQEIIDPLVGYIEGNWRSWLSNAVQLGKDLANKISKGVKNKANELANDAVKMGKGLVDGFIDGVEEKMQAGKEAVREFVREVRHLLPGSDAETGPLSDLTASGEALPQTFAQGISQAKAGEKAVRDSMAKIHRALPKGSSNTGPLFDLTAVDEFIDGFESKTKIAQTKVRDSMAKIHRALSKRDMKIGSLFDLTAINKALESVKELRNTIEQITNLNSNIHVTLESDVMVNNDANNITPDRMISADSFRGDVTTLDGRQLSESTGRYRADPSRRRNI